MYNPLVSIIIPVYNGSNYLRESIDSSLAQTYKNVEVIVVNDGSNDEGATERIAMSYANRIRYFYKANGGVSSALNLGIEMMNGEWFSWLSHDDLYMPDKIKSAIEKVSSKGLDVSRTIISCKTGLINADGAAIFRPKKFHGGMFSGKEMFKNLCDENSLGGCSLLIPKASLEEIGGFNIEHRFIQDWVCWLTLALHGNFFYLYEEDLVKSRVHGNQDTIKLAELRPIEINNFLNNLLDILGRNAHSNEYFLKTILFYCCTRINNKEIINKYIDKLKEHNLYHISDRVKYTAFYIRGKFIWKIKKIYRSMVNKRYRGVIR